jgi:Mn2+/Fe2+ NRAMP family transporter
LKDRAPIEGLPSASAPSPEELAAEIEWLREQESRSGLSRSFAFLRKGGPGYLQSALTLGGGTAATMLFAGAAFGYGLLWVAPVSMVLGVIMMSAVAHQTLSTGLRPFEAMRVYAGPVFAWGFAGGAVISSIIWHFAQYSLGAAVISDMGQAAGVEISHGLGGAIVLAVAVVWAFAYGKSSKALRYFETSLKVLVWGIVGCFGLVVLKTGIHDPVALINGYIPFQFPESDSGVQASTVVVGGLAAAVGANMLFLYPYSLLARGWGRDHRRLANFDLIAGMFLPYMLATSLMVIATANAFHYGDLEFSGTRLSPVEAAQALATAVGEGFGRWIFNLGILGMAVSSIILQMVCCGFVATEVLGWRFGSKRYRLACLLPAPGVLGAVLWTDVALWVAVPTTLLCGFMLPLAYIGFIKLQRNHDYLGDDVPGGGKGAAWLGGMVLATLTLTVFLIWYAITKGPDFFGRLFG